MMIRRLLVCGILCGWQQWAGGQTTEPGGDAAEVYLHAAQIIRDDDAKNIMAPAASNAVFRRYYPPLPDDWVQMEKQDYDLHAQVRELVHEAGTMQRADWPAIDPNRKNPNQYGPWNECRNLANEIADAAKYQSLVLKDQPAAFESAGDLLRLSELLKNKPGENLVRLLVAEGIDAIDMSRLMLTISNAKITENASDTQDLPLATANQWIARLLDHPDTQAELDQAMQGEPPGASANPIVKRSLVRALETVHRVQAERDLAAMVLAAHVYQYKHGNWPANLDELKTELPRLPVDPWGDGKQTLGYVLIAGGLPDGSDRPLVYSHCGMKNGLFFRTDEPQYSFYNSAGLNRTPGQGKQGGQFRDVASWAPAQGANGGATTRPLE
jgi:hypothetical protein